ncbi:MAG TPA: hypothetical protein VJT73_20600 [Polyangiaceae bacterium]|nr:hypothetical protein [Polyangiaceae bacterium]
MAIVVPAEEKKSFCAFLYGIRFKPDIQAAFKDYTQSNAVMDAYHLTQDQKKYVWALHPEQHPDLTDAEKATLWASLVALLLPEFYKWTYDDKPIPWW